MNFLFESVMELLDNDDASYRGQTMHWEHSLLRIAMDDRLKLKMLGFIPWF